MSATKKMNGLKGSLKKMGISIGLLFTCLFAGAQTYDLTISYQGQPTVGQPLNITITGTSSVMDLSRLSVFSETDGTTVLINGQPWINCNSSCDVLAGSFIYTQNYSASVKFTAYLMNTSNQTVKSQTWQVSFQCGTEYCPPNPVLSDFTFWMRSKGYQECIISKYNENASNPEFFPGIMAFLSKRPAATSQVLDVHFYDIVPTDPQATYKSLGQGEGGTCQNDPSTQPPYCPNPVPADYLFLEKRFEHTFGMDINFIYHRIDTSYVAALGQPTFTNGTYKFGSRYSFNQKFQIHSIVHWAAETWNGFAIGDMTGASHVAETNWEPFNLSGATVATHEWGHTWGLPHPFVNIDNQLKFFSFDGIMDNSYRQPGSNLLDVMSPLERYALEPPGGYLDNATFVQEYNAGIIGGVDLPTCQTVDPTIVEAGLVSESANDYIVGVQLNNLGSIPVGYVRLKVYNGNLQGNLLADRIIENISVEGPLVSQFTISKASFGSSLLFVLDPQNEIINENENNNSVTISIPFAPICVNPSGLAISNITSSTADINWPYVIGTGNYQFEYRKSGNANWIVLPIQVQPNVTLQNLLSGTTYEIRVKRVCAIGNSVYSGITSFATVCTNFIPQALTTLVLQPNSATLSWSTGPEAAQYEIGYSETESGIWNYVISDVVPAQININSNVGYLWKVRPACSSAILPWSDIKIMDPLNYCLPKTPPSLFQARISQVQIGNFVNMMSGTGYTPNLIGYFDFTRSGPSYTLSTSPGAFLPIALTINADNYLSTNDYFWKAWIDFNMNGVFEGSEVVFSIGGLITNPVSGNIQIPSTIANISTRMRIMLGINPIQDACEQNYYVQTKDYLVNIACGTPTNLAASNITSGSTKISWSDPNGVASYVLDYRKTGDLNWASTVSIIGQTNYLVTGLVASTSYEARVQRVCDSNHSNYTNIISFTTLSCPVPQSLSVPNIASSSASLSWSDPEGAVNYTLEYKANGEANWTALNVQGQTNSTINHLTSGTFYSARVKRLCNSSESSYSNTIDFNTPCDAPTNLTATNITNTGADITWGDMNGPGTYSLEYRKKNTQNWNALGVAQNQYYYSITNLLAGTTYEVRIQRLCTDAASTYTATEFTTTCTAPQTLTVSNITPYQATLQWNSVGGVTGYIYNIHPAGTLAGAFQSVSGTSTTVYGLQAGRQYQFDIGASCTTENYKSILFTTTDYCYSNGSNKNEYIDLVEIQGAGFSRTSGAERDGYYFNKAQVPIDIQIPGILPTPSYTLNFSAGGFKSGTRTENLKVWIDYTRDGDFDDLGELIVNTSLTSTGTLSFSLVPGAAIAGITRMRVSMKNNLAQTSCETGFNGEVEDYLLNFTNSGGPSSRISNPENVAQTAEENETILLYPNPVANLLNLTLDEEMTKESVKLTIIDVLGKKIWEGDYQQQIDVSTTLSSGVYVLLVQGKTKRSQLKFVKE